MNVLYRQILRKNEQTNEQGNRLAKVQTNKQTDKWCKQTTTEQGK